MKKSILICAIVAVSFSLKSQDIVYGAFLSAQKIEKISSNPISGVTSGSFSDVKTVISTAALGASNDGWLYYLQYGTFGNGSGNGRVDVWATKADGTGNPVQVLSNFDVNGSSNSDLGFVRLGIDKNNKAWIIAKETFFGNSIYMRSFTVNGATAIAGPAAVQVNTSDNSNSVFENGDLAFDGQGVLYALANNSSGSTKLYIINPTNSTTLTYKWTIKKSDGSNFTGRVSGCAFSSTGSMYVSTDDGIYFIDQNTTNFLGVGTVLSTKVKDQTDVTDLATAYWPMFTRLPVRFKSIQTRIIKSVNY